MQVSSFGSIEEIIRDANRREVRDMNVVQARNVCLVGTYCPGVGPHIRQVPRSVQAHPKDYKAMPWDDPTNPVECAAHIAWLADQAQTLRES